MYHFATICCTRKQRHVTLGHMERLGHQRDNRRVGFALIRWGRDSDFERWPVRRIDHAKDTRARGFGRNPQAQHKAVLAFCVV